jgi:hypothetical protein
MIYDLNYFETLLRNNSATAEKISRIRWDFIAEIHPRVVLDYGSGAGWFRAFRPQDITVDSYDIASYPQTGILHDKYDVICFWDVFEHIPDFSVIVNLLKNTDYVALSLPLKPREGINWLEWKHFKPLEHLHYFDLALLDATMSYFKFTRIKSGQPECPPREDIFSLIYRSI